MRISGLTALALAALGACDTAGPTRATAPAPPVASAYFTESPAALIEAARAACSHPGESFHIPRPGVAQCRLYLDPETTAAVILGYDGAIRALPQLVVSLSQARAGDGYLVTVCAFLKVPQKDGSIARIAQSDSAIEAKLNQMLTAVGGKRVRDVPPEAAAHCFSL